MIDQYPEHVTQYYFDTFIVAKHHSLHELHRDLLVRQEAITEYLNRQPTHDIQNLLTISEMIGEFISKNPVSERRTEREESQYWINELGKRAGLEINTYGRLRPETLELMLCMKEDEFVSIMSIADHITKKIQSLTEIASNTPLPANLPILG